MICIEVSHINYSLWIIDWLSKARVCGLFFSIKPVIILIAIATERNTMAQFSLFLYFTKTPTDKMLYKWRMKQCLFVCFMLSTFNSVCLITLFHCRFESPWNMHNWMYNTVIGMASMRWFCMLRASGYQLVVAIFGFWFSEPRIELPSQFTTK